MPVDTPLTRVVARPSYEAYGKVDLIDPVPSGFIQVAAEVERRPPFLPASGAKRALLADCTRLCRDLAARDGVIGAVTFRSALVPPGRGAFLARHPDVHVAGFDVAVLIETSSIERARELRHDGAFGALESRIRASATYTHVVTATNVKRIGPVDHSRDGLFLFNYFFAADTARNLAVWEYTAGWFQQETGLDNSTVLLPDAGEASQYNIINHCRWDGLDDILPSLIFKRSFRDYVLANFEANEVAAMPVLYRMA